MPELLSQSGSLAIGADTNNIGDLRGVGYAEAMSQ
tara:strand:- start:146 stop:250 length:105 start_codon:yes stop_codon:yes gene_type:complete